jgi:hypothetical protein
VNTVLWIVTTLLAVIVVAVALMKLTRPKPALVKAGQGVGREPPTRDTQSSPAGGSDTRSCSRSDRMQPMRGTKGLLTGCPWPAARGSADDDPHSVRRVGSRRRG